MSQTFWRIGCIERYRLGRKKENNHRQHLKTQSSSSLLARGKYSIDYKSKFPANNELEVRSEYNLINRHLACIRNIPFVDDTVQCKSTYNNSEMTACMRKATSEVVPTEVG